MCQIIQKGIFFPGEEDVLVVKKVDLVIGVFCSILIYLTHQATFSSHYPTGIKESSICLSQVCCFCLGLAQILFSDSLFSSVFVKITFTHIFEHSEVLLEHQTFLFFTIKVKVAV